MPTSAQPTGAIVATLVLGIVALFLWIPLVAGLSNLSGSDAAGNAMSQGFTAIGLILLWVLLAIIAIIALVNGTMPKFALLSALLLVPASGFASMAALDLLSHPYLPPYILPIVIPALIPPLIVIFCLWTLSPAAQAAIPARTVSGIVWGATLILCVSIFPFLGMRGIAVEQQQKARDKYAADFAALPPDAPLWDWTPFLDTPDQTRSSATLDRIRQLDHRQSDAEIMLDRGDFPLLYLGSMDLTPTQSLCDKTHALLRRQVEPLVPQKPDTKRYVEVAEPVSNALSAMKWLVGYGCSSDAESQAWEDMANKYRDTNFDVVELRELRDPKNLGRLLREYPERFSMLTPQAHLKGWLSFADKPEYREQALSGASKLDHRTADAIEMLSDNEFVAGKVLQYIPVLDLEYTPQLCAAALKWVRTDFANVHRPRADDPRPYRELLDRLGGYEPMRALTWLAGHGCDADAELSEAESVVRSYQPSPQSAEMLATLAQLHRKP